jgi:AcrR family transcriptional regulator
VKFRFTHYTEVGFRLSSPPPTSTAERPLRADARRNRERILEAAREIFAESGLDAQMEDLARGAGVGVGTVYRHFPTKEALVGALVDDYFGSLAVEAESALAVADPWEAFEGFMWRAGNLLGANRALSEVTADGQMREGAVRAGVDRILGELIGRAQDAGVLRPDVSVDDVPMIMCSLGRVQMLGAGGPGEAWRRHLAIMLDGLRATGASPLPRG